MPSTVLKPDRQGRITLPGQLKRAGLVQCDEQPDGSVLLYPVRVVRDYPSMEGLPEASDLPPDLAASLERSLDSAIPGIRATTPAEALAKRNKGKKT